MNTKIRVMMKAVPQGSHSAFIVKTKSGMNRAVITDTKSQSLYAERIAIAEEYKKADGIFIESEGVSIDITFGFVKPKSAPKRITVKTTKPDIDKLSRAVLDSLTNVAFKDDSQVCMLTAKKIFAREDYIDITVSPFQSGADNDS